MAKKKKNNLFLSHYVIGFFDLLGQQEQLRNLKELPTNDTEKEEFIRILKGTYGSVMAMQQSFSDFYKSFTKTDTDKSELTQEQKRIQSELQKTKIKFQNFSDCIVAYSSLRDDTCKLPIRSVYGVLGAAAITFLTCLVRGHPIRGGIDIGLAMEAKKNEIYGPALSRAYALESKLANYPRIVIGNELVNYLRLNAQETSNDIYNKAKMVSAQLCLGTLTVDHDGLTILDYLGDGFNSGGGHQLHEEIIALAYKKLLELSTQYKKEKNSKIATKYTLLRNYFETKRPDVAQKVMGHD